jgi:hypothetical protein
VALVAVDSSKPDLDEGEIGREHYGWIEDGFDAEADLRIFVCHHHLVPVPGTGRERHQVLDAGDVLSLLRQCGVDLVLSGHRHVPYVWPIAGMLLVHSGTVSTLRTRGFPHPAYNLLTVEEGRISVELHIPGVADKAWVITRAIGPPTCRLVTPTRSCARHAVSRSPTTNSRHRRRREPRGRSPISSGSPRPRHHIERAKRARSRTPTPFSPAYQSF